MTIINASILVTVLFSTVSFAQTIEKQYAQLKHWNITAEYENGQFLGCFASTYNSGAQSGYGSLLRIAISDQLHILATDYNLPATSQHTDLIIDNTSYKSTFLQFDQWAGMKLSADTLQALRQGIQVNFNFDPNGPIFPLSGSYAAILKAQECDKALALEPQLSSTITANNQEHCPNNDRKLPESGLCMADARKLLDQHTNPIPTASKGCSWEVNETAMPGGEFLLYNAYKCKDTTAKLAFQGGAKSATLAVSQSAFLGDKAIGTELVTIGSIDSHNVIDSVLDYVLSQMEPDEKNNQCFVQPGLAYDLPANSYVVNVDDEYLSHKYLSRKKLDDGYLTAAASNTDKPDAVASCGNWGYLSSSYSLWRIFGGFTWFFDFGQDVSEFDPASFSLITQNDQGQWQVVK